MFAVPRTVWVGNDWLTHDVTVDFWKHYDSFCLHTNPLIAQIGRVAYTWLYCERCICYKRKTARAGYWPRFNRVIETNGEDDDVRSLF